ncbi:MAG TPA: phospholipase D-like domain-containing protein [Candidatus Binataceae bacterium]|nr:phospholipase D-like domain-containing protein [Candidatus Binataceae bacterium]
MRTAGGLRLYRWLRRFCLLILIGAAGCADTLPNARANIRAIAARAHRLPQIVNSQEQPLTPDQRQMLLEQIEAEGAASPELLAHLPLLEAIGGAPLAIGNRVTLLQNGPVTYAAMRRAILQAQHSINLETFIFADDSVGREFAALLMDRSRHGVQVNVIYDALGSLTTSQSLFDQMRAAHIAVLAFNPIRLLRHLPGRSLEHRDHRKLLVVDGRLAITGGVNLTSDYTHGFSTSGRPRTGNGDELFWRDTDVEIQGPAVAQCQQLFVDTWFRQTGKLLPRAEYFPTLHRQGDDLVEVIGSTPDAPISAIYLTLLVAIHNAEKNVWITDAYFVPDHQFVTDLRTAARRGVDVELDLPHITDHPVVLYASRSHYTSLLKSGVKIYERTGALLHAKTATIDGIWSTVGSANLDWWSFARDDEINVVVLSPSFAQQMEMMFKADREQSEQIQLATWHHRRLWERAQEWLARLIQPLL